jgi:RNA polymerase subunit RPABC4/transcription elongation factor Spt4
MGWYCRECKIGVLTGSALCPGCGRSRKSEKKEGT